MPIDRQGGPLQARATLAFSILVVTGPFIWWPKDWSWTNLKKIVVLRRGLGGRALYWNWHNVLGAWCAIPLLIIVMSGVVMSYPWANNLLYRLTGNEPPPPPQVTTGQQRPRSEGKPHDDTAPQSSVSPLEKVITATEQVSGWRSITVRMPSGRGPLSATADQGDGRPDLRTQFIFDSKTGEVRQETFSSYNSGRRLRTWARFSHTGEAGGIVGETIAAIAAAGASVLAFTGITLSIKRLISWRTRS
jgi:uncharacterized iron-regulated membrane protein